MHPFTILLLAIFGMFFLACGITLLGEAREKKLKKRREILRRLEIKTKFPWLD